MIAQLLRDFAALFVVTGPGARTNRRTLVVLALIVLAGAVLRFWGLGSVGLHGDEKTMALPVMNLVEHGQPIMPSGMFYPRAVAQLYLMAASVMAFGQSEWALRLPSVLCGIALIVLMWKVGARFLTPVWNLSLAAAVAFLPSFIEDAQTARMYVFLVTCVAGYLALVFAWERSGRVGYLAAAVVTMWVGIQFHTLAIFAAFLVLLPGLLQGDQRKLWEGAVAFALIVLGFASINWLIGHAYPQTVESDAGAVANGPHAAVIPHLGRLWLLVAALPAMLFARWVLVGRSSGSMVALLTLTGALVAELALAWHLAVLLTLVALVFARRSGSLSSLRLAVFLVVSVAIGVGESVFLVTHAAGSPKQILGVMLGWPSVWPFIAIAEYSTVVMLAAVGSLACGLWFLAHRRAVPDYVLLLVLGVWVPLLMIGFIKWNIPSRYAAAQIVPLLVAAFAAMQGAVAWGVRRAREHAADPYPVWAPAVTVLAFLLVVNPVQVVAAINSGYSSHPDHKGAAEFVAALHPGPRDIIVAEDVLQQTYYLGHVDYWLVNKQVAAPFMHKVKGHWLDFYTDTPLIGTGPELERLVDEPNRGAIYVIGSGENQSDGRSLMRAFGISEALHSPPFRVVYRGRDGFTQVWKVDPPAPTVSRGH
jgi:4-amino-4-deoxy-L-arabinose transferase-like glycosyltransferase